MDCTHRWTIATPVDGVARGICRRCGQERAFSDSAYTAAWQSTAAQERRRRGRLAGARSRAKRGRPWNDAPPTDTAAHP
jgi:hypothetical protein